jgi:hypothetical protein
VSRICDGPRRTEVFLRVHRFSTPIIFPPKVRTHLHLNTALTGRKGLGTLKPAMLSPISEQHWVQYNLFIFYLFPRLQVATACSSCRPPDLNFLDPYSIFMYMLYNHCHWATAQLQLNIYTWGNPKIPGIVKKKNYLKYLYKFETSVPIRSTPPATVCSNPSTAPNSGNTVLTFRRRNFLLNFSTPCIYVGGGDQKILGIVKKNY